MTKGDRAGSQEELVIHTFDEKAATYAEGYRGGSTSAHSFNVRLRRVYELLEGRRSGKVLDVGCGPGITVAHLVASGFEVYGVDISKEMINECEKEFGHLPQAHFSVGKIEHLDFPDSYFDVVLSVGVVEYVDDDRVAIEEMARVVKPGGAVIVTLPNWVSPYRIWQRTFYQGARRLARAVTGRGAPPEVAHREYSARAYSELLASSGLRVTDIAYYNFSVLLFPFDRLLPRLAVSLGDRMERFARSGPRWLGTGFIVKAEKSAL